MNPILLNTHTSDSPPSPSRTPTPVNVHPITDNTGKIITIRVKRIDRTIDYHRTNRGADEAFNLLQGELHDFFPHVKDFSTVMKDKFVLDLGCGDGALVRDLRQMKVNAVGVDLFLTPEMRRSHFIAADAFQLPFRSSSVDTILSIWSVFNYEPLFQIRPLLDQALSILKPRGRLFISAVHDPKKIQLIKDWCEKNHTHVFTALPGKALQLIKK